MNVQTQKKRKGVSLESSYDSESEENGKVVRNLVAFGAHKEESDSNVGQTMRSITSCTTSG